MVERRSPWQSRLMSIRPAWRRIVAPTYAALVLIAAASFLTPNALAADASVAVSGVVGPWVGVEFTDDGVLLGESSTTGVEVTRTLIGDTMVTRIIATGS